MVIVPRVHAVDATEPTEGLAEIVVTAQKRTESVQEVPISIQAISGAQLENAGITNMSELGLLAPNFAWAQVTGNPEISLRGIPSLVSGVSGQSSVGLTMDGVPLFNMLYLSSGVFDLDRIEVLHGPQGTVNGRNSTGGAINLIAARPTSDFEADAKITGGNLGTQGYEGYVSGPISDLLSARLAAVHNRQDGYVTLESGEKQGSVNDTGARFSMDFHPSPIFDALLIADYWHDYNTDYPFVALGGVIPGVPLYDGGFPLPWYNSSAMTSENNFSGGVDKENTRGISLNMTFDLSDGVMLRSITGYRNLDHVNFTSESNSPLPYPLGGKDNPGTFVQSDELVSQELTVSSKGSGPFQWLAGGLIQHDIANEQLVGIYPYLGLPSPGLINFTEQSTVSYGFYAQGQYKFTDQWQLTAGGRYSHDAVDMVAPYYIPPPALGATLHASGEATWDKFTPRVALEYNVTPDAMLYASWATGYKSGGFDNEAQQSVLACLGFAPGGCQNVEYQPETVNTWEVGAKTEWFDHRLIANLTLFDQKLKNLQNIVYLIGGTVIDSAGKATSKGAELEVRAVLARGFDFYFSGAYTDATYTEFVVNNNVTGVNNENLDGNQLPLSAKYAFNTGLSYKTPISVGTLTLAADYSWKSKVYFTFFNYDAESQSAFGLLDLRASLGLLSDKLILSVFGRNVTNEKYITNAVNVPWPLAAAPNILGASMVEATPGLPRIYGGSIEYKF